MPTEPKIENYLTHLDRALGLIPVSDRAEIITEIKSHILEAQSRNTDTTVDSILKSMGEPETVANRYLLERGLKPQKPPQDRALKWILIFFASVFGFIILSIVALVWFFTPILSVDSTNERVKIFGNLISIDGKSITNGNFHHVSGSKTILLKDTKELHIPFSNGKFEIKTSSNDQFHYSCKLAESKNKEIIREEKQALYLQLDQASSVKCSLDIPKGLALILEGTNVKASIKQPEFPILGKFTNAAITFEPKKGAQYQFKHESKFGSISDLPQSKDPKAILIEIHSTTLKMKTETIESDEKSED